MTQHKTHFGGKHRRHGCLDRRLAACRELFSLYVYGTVSRTAVLAGANLYSRASLRVRYRCRPCPVSFPLQIFQKATVKSVEECERQAARIGYPLMIKASEGGGGKGIRMVDRAEQLRSAYEQVWHYQFPLVPFTVVPLDVPCRASASWSECLCLVSGVLAFGTRGPCLRTTSLSALLFCPRRTSKSTFRVFGSNAVAPSSYYYPIRICLISEHAWATPDRGNANREPAATAFSFFGFMLLEPLLGTTHILEPTATEHHARGDTARRVLCA